MAICLAVGAGRGALNHLLAAEAEILRVGPR
jgi:hypothetical protein